MEKRGIVVGGGAFGREVLSWAGDAGAKGREWHATHFLDRNPESLHQFADTQLDYLGDPETYMPSEGDVFILAIGDPKVKLAVATRLLAHGAVFGTVIHPSAVLSSTAHLGRGVVVGPHCYIATHSCIGDFTCINSLSGIGHDAVLGQSCTVSSQVDVMGAVKLGDRVFVGSGARILPEVQVMEDCRIGAGSVVVKNLKASSSVYAAPARKI
jgi:sugar O-acyltransferase (sialic acid O-acetyltransferase NeuD family)